LIDGPQPYIINLILVYPDMINVQDLTIGEVAGVINIGLIFGIRHPYFFVDATATNKSG
jgi:hypothetical protein